MWTGSFSIKIGISCIFRDLRRVECNSLSGGKESPYLSLYPASKNSNSSCSETKVEISNSWERVNLNVSAWPCILCVSIFILFRPCFFALLIQPTKLHIVMHSLFSTLLDNLTETMTHLNVQFKLYSFLTHIALRWLPRVFTNNPSHLAYFTEGTLLTLSLRFCSQVSPRR